MKTRITLTTLVLVAGLALGTLTTSVFADALKTAAAPTVNGVVSPGEWDSAQVEFDTGPRPCEPANPGGWDLSGAKGRFLWDDTNVYGLVEAYPNTCGLGANPNGPFDQMNWEVYINALGWPAAVFLDTTFPNNNHPGSTVVFSADRMVIEFSVPIATIIDNTGGNLPNPYTFNPSGGDFLEYRLRTTDPDAAGGFDSRDQTLGWVVEPLETGGGWRRLDFASPPPTIVYVDDDYDATGCTADGHTWQVDCFDVIQDGVDAVVSGGTVNVAAGTYAEYLHITTDGLTIQGAGIGQSIIDLDGLTPYWHYAGCSSSFASRAGVYISGYGSPDEIVEDVTFKGFTVKNAGLNPPTTATGTHTGADNVAILTDATAAWTPGALVGQWVHNLDDRYIGTSGGNQPIRSYGQITANTATTVIATLTGGLENDWDNGDTYVITPYEHFLDSSNKDGQDDVHGIGVANGKNVVIEDCKVQNSGARGITVGKARCTSLQQSENITVKNCIVLDNHSNGISIGDHIGTITITGNTCSNNKRPHISDPTREYAGIGIYARGGSESKKITGVISGNTVSGNGFEGITLYRWVDGVTIENNTVTGHNFDQDGAGIFFYYWGRPERCKNVTVRNNTVTGNIRGIVAYYASDSTIEGNTITTDSGAFPKGQEGIKIDGGNNIEVKDNTVSCDGIGMSVVYWEGYGSVSSYDNTFTGNIISGAKFAGIFISGDAHDNTFTCNTIADTASLTLWEGQSWEETQADGVFLDDDAGTGNVFHDNAIYGNADDGMENQTTTTIDAEYNWWGCSAGPGNKNCDTVNGPVDYDPWATSKPPCCGEPTAITLASFTAQAGAGGVTLAWETATEVDNAGFNLYRAMVEDGPYTQINETLIAAEGDAVSGASYSFVDRPDYGTFYYKLEDVDYYGVSTLHGPVRVTLARPLRRPLYRPTLPALW